MAEFLMIIVSAVFINNFVVVQFLGICPFLGVSKDFKSALGMGIAVTFVMTITCLITYPIYTYVLVPLKIDFMDEAYSPLGRKYSRVFFITISTGLGGSFCVDKTVQDYVTEVGHTLAKFEGTIQEYSILTGAKFSIFAELVGDKNLTPKSMFEGARQKDKKYQQFLDKWLQFLNNFVQLMKDSYCPEIIVFTGGFMKDKDMFLKRIKKLNKDVKIKETYFGTNAGLIGAGLYAIHSLKEGN